MTVSGRITAPPRRRLRILIGAHAFWLAVVCLLGAWWSRLVLSQASRIAELESALGMPAQALANHARTQRMVFWESLTYFVLLIGSSLVVFWLYWRDSQRSRGVQAFFASMTHELRTPLTSIRLQAEALAEGLEGNPAQKSWVDRLLEDTMRLESQVERTLELARVEGGGPVFPEPMELTPWFDRLVSGWKDAYGQRIRFEVSIPDVTAMADPTALGVVMRNLIENSVRHAKPRASDGGKLVIRIQGAASPEGVHLLFADNGASFAGDVTRLGKIFEKGPGSSGTGVGLYLIRVLVNQMGGQASFAASNSPDAKSGFEVRIRLNAAPETAGTKELAHG